MAGKEDHPDSQRGQGTDRSDGEAGRDDTEVGFSVGHIVVGVGVGVLQLACHYLLLDRRGQTEGWDWPGQLRGAGRGQEGRHTTQPTANTGQRIT